MPYRHAHWFLLLLFPLTGLAFWPGYFSKMADSPAAIHVHGVTASLWIFLLAFQSWAIHRRRNALHRMVGLTSFALFPFFVTGGLLVIQTMAVKVAAGSDIFFDMFGARLGAIDAMSSLGILGFFYMALLNRRKVQLHARYMLAPMLFLLAPILSRLLPILPPLAIAGPQDFYRFGYGLHLANGLAIAIAAILYVRAPKHGRPWLVAGALVAAQSLVFETFGASEAWQAVFRAIGTLPVPLIAGVGFAASIFILFAGWNARPTPPRTAAPA